MTLPARIRVNVAAPFPAMVTGQNGISLGKQNGIWTVGLNINSLATSVPPANAFANDYVVVYDSTTGANSKVALSTIQSGIVTTVSALPAPSTALTGARNFISDAIQTFSSANFGVAPTGGGGNKVPVVCDGTAWRIG